MPLNFYSKEAEEIIRIKIAVKFNVKFYAINLLNCFILIEN
jgi:hypothetical protein